MFAYFEGKILLFLYILLSARKKNTFRHLCTVYFSDFTFLCSGSFFHVAIPFFWQICLRLQSQRANTDEKKRKPTLKIGPHIEKRMERERKKSC